MSDNKLVDFDVELRITGSVLNDMKGFSFDLDGEKIDTTNFDHGKWEKIIAGHKDLKISVNGNLDKSSPNNVLDLIAALLSEEVLPYSIFYKTAAAPQRESISGIALIENATLNMDDGTDVKWTCSLQNSGDPVFTNKSA